MSIEKQIDDYINESEEKNKIYVQEELDYAEKCHNLEKELGCPLEVLFKAMGHCVYDENGRGYYIEHYYQERGVYQIHSVLYKGRIVEKGFNLKDYKKTWWLKEDKSE